jgi:methyltransferase
MSLGLVVLILVTFQRLSELVIAHSNTKHLLALGAKEVAPEHYWLIVIVHASWLAGLWWLGPSLPVNLFWLTVFVVLQMLRIWILVSLGRRWTTRIVVLPGAPLVKSGPYRFLSHPNYAVVVGEIAVLPLAFGLYAFALVFTCLNAAVLTIRIRAENSAIGSRSMEPRDVVS